LRVFSEVTVAQKVHSESRREWRSANAGFDGDMCEVMTSCGGKRSVVVLGLSRCCGSGLAPILKPPIFLPHVMITLTSAEVGGPNSSPIEKESPKAKRNV
jgi:hypothetical protein